MGMLEVYGIGTEITVDGDIPATIRGIMIYSEAWIKYLCVWWNGHERKEEWLTVDEIKITESVKTSIKFK